MPAFEVITDKVAARNLQVDDHIMLKDQLWRLVSNFPVIGGGGRMLMLAYHTHIDPQGYKFHAIGSDERLEVFRPIK